MPKPEELLNSSGEISRPSEKYFIALLAGLTPVATKYLARDSDKAIMDLLGIYAATSICLIILGLIVCYLTNETNRMKLFMLALSAPALISNLSGSTDISTESVSNGANRAGLEEIFVSKAHAMDSSGQSLVIQAGFIDNVQRYFGKSDPAESAGYWVIVLSTKDVAVAANVAEQINRIDSSYNAFVGNRRPGNPFYPVIVGNWSNQNQANQLKTRAATLRNQIPQITDAPYLDNYSDRR